ncbi:hypothetical protein WQ56_12350 [Luteimonas sp. FCS-9]|nr:hypothetical protein WQ56_12350 [Luteimonas sp. FCS-9]
MPAPPAPPLPVPAATTDDAPRPASRAGDASRTVPSFARPRARGTRGPDTRPWLWAAAIGLALLLALQGLLADRARLAGDPAWRPLLETLCGALGCTLPPWREPAALALLARDVRAQPQDPARLQVTATFRNDARWPQAWPRLRLVLSDVDGREVGRREFTAQEYLGGPPPAPTLAPGASAQARLTVAEPATGAVSFAFELL